MRRLTSAINALEHSDVFSKSFFQSVRQFQIDACAPVRLESLLGYSFLILLVRDERFCLDEVFYLSVFAEAAGIVGFIRILIPFGYVGL